METVVNYQNTNELLQKASENLQLKNYNGAISLYEQALEQNNLLYRAYLKLGAIHESMMNTEKAKTVYLKGLEVAELENNKPAVREISYTLLGLME